MDIDLNQLKENYRALSDDALANVYYTADLIDGARELLIKEIESRGLEIDVEDHISHVEHINAAEDESVNKILSPIIFYTLIFVIIYILSNLGDIFKQINFELVAALSAFIYIILGIIKVYQAVSNPSLSCRPIWYIKKSSIFYKIIMFFLSLILWPFIRYD